LWSVVLVDYAFEQLRVDSSTLMNPKLCCGLVQCNRLHFRAFANGMLGFLP